MSREIIRVEDASVRFNLAMQKNVGIKEYVSKALHRELFFQEFFALRHIDLSVMAGESWGFVGRNGSGKSTLLKLITGILKPYEGSVTVNGHVSPLLELGAGFDPELTGRENIMMNGLILGMTKAQIQEHFDDIVAFAELEKFLDVPIKNYSSGMKSRLGFSIATCMKPEILIADEVLSTGDRIFQQKCEKRMQELLADGTTLLFVSHSAASVRKLCKKVMWLDSGSIKMCGNTDEVMRQYENK
ncbi:MAG: ABC transporter ATP-binding protein [Clostridia bacterium]|nr:ABC transporter ATP-binding protein [Clostridia bacterium]